MPQQILLVEDDLDVAELIEMCLTTLLPGVVVQHVDNGMKAMQLLRDHQPFELIVCDIMMPGMDGARLVLELHQRGLLGAYQVMILSAVERSQIAEVLAVPQVVDYLQKPIDPMELANRVAAHIG